MLRRLLTLAVPAIILTASVLGPPAAHAALTMGSWESPASGATISGTVTLQFKTQATSVTFNVPGNSDLVGTISNGVASASFDTTKAANSTVNLIADECDATGCSNYFQSVTIYNAPPTPPAVLFTPPSGSTIASGGAITVSGGTGVADVKTYFAGSPSFSGRDYGSEPLPFTFHESNGEIQPYDLGVSAGASTAVFHILTADTIPPLLSVSSAPKRFFPRRDGYEDSFTVPVITNEQVTAKLYLTKGGKVVAQGVTTTFNDEHARHPATVSAGAGLPAGKYGWYVVATDPVGNMTRSKTYSVIADPRRLVWRTRTLQLPGDYNAYDASGLCSDALRRGTDEVLQSRPNCLFPRPAASAGIYASDEGEAEVSYGIQIPKAITTKYRSLVVTVSFTGGPAALAIEDGMNGLQFLAFGPVVSEGPTVTGRAGSSAIQPSKPIVNVLVGTNDGHNVTLTHVRFSYQYQALGP